MSRGPCWLPFPPGPSNDRLITIWYHRVRFPCGLERCTPGARRPPHGSHGASRMRMPGVTAASGHSDRTALTREPTPIGSERVARYAASSTLRTVLLALNRLPGVGVRRPLTTPSPKSAEEVKGIAPRRPDDLVRACWLARAGRGHSLQQQRARTPPVPGHADARTLQRARLGETAGSGQAGIPGHVAGVRGRLADSRLSVGIAGALRRGRRLVPPDARSVPELPERDRDSGRPSFHPDVTIASPNDAAAQATVVDCADSSHWVDYYKSGKPAPGEAQGRQRIYARLRPFDGEWKVTYLVVEKVGTC